MDIKRYFAPDMRRAINQVRKEHGPDAVILSSEAVEGGIEIIAAIEYDPALFTQLTAATSQDARAASDPEPEIESGSGSDDEAPTESAIEPGPVEITAAKLVETRAPITEVRSDLDTSQELKAIQQDLYALKGLVRERFAWSDLRAMTPERSWLMRRAEALGLSAKVADTIVGEVEHPAQDDRAWREVVFALARRLSVMREDPTDAGGIIALVGPTGVGKTTTIAKLAARHSMQHGRDSVALITTDNYRIGAQRQLEAFGAILGLPVYSADSPEKLAELIGELQHKRLVLIDTAGSASRDSASTAALDSLDSALSVKRFLVLAANLQAEVMQQAVDAFGGRRIDGAIFTKIDETSCLGAAISAVVESRLPIVWLSNGQRVPEDLKLARVTDLLQQAAKVAKSDNQFRAPAFSASQLQGLVAEGSHERT